MKFSSSKNMISVDKVFLLLFTNILFICISIIHGLSLNYIFNKKLFKVKPSHSIYLQRNFTILIKFYLFWRILSRNTNACILPSSLTWLTILCRLFYLPSYALKSCENQMRIWWKWSGIWTATFGTYSLSINLTLVFFL